MSKTMLGALAGVGLVIAAVGLFDRTTEALAQRPGPVGSYATGSELIVVPGPDGEKGQLLTVIDPHARVMGVYHVDQQTGKIGLRSVRNIHWDLQMTYLDNEGLLPQEIHAMLEQR